MRKTLTALAIICASASAFAQATQPTTPTPTGSPTGGVPNPVTPMVGPSAVENKGEAVENRGDPSHESTAPQQQQGAAPNAIAVSPPVTSGAQVDPIITATPPQPLPNTTQEVPNNTSQAIPNSNSEVVPNVTSRVVPGSNCGAACKGSDCVPVGCSGTAPH